MSWYDALQVILIDRLAVQVLVVLLLPRCSVPRSEISSLRILIASGGRIQVVGASDSPCVAGRVVAMARAAVLVRR